MFKRIYDAFFGGTSLKDVKSIWGRLRHLKHDRRERRFFYQRLEDGFSDDDLWNLDGTIARFVLPRLQRFRDIEAGFPGCFEEAREWHKILDKMIYAMDHLANGKQYEGDYDQQKAQKVQEGCKLFGKWFQSLWY